MLTIRRSTANGLENVSRDAVADLLPRGDAWTKALWGQVFIFAVLLCGSSSGESMQAATDKWHETGAIMGVAS